MLTIKTRTVAGQWVEVEIKCDNTTIAFDVDKNNAEPVMDTLMGAIIDIGRIARDGHSDADVETIHHMAICHLISR